ncbi:uncharacterized protein LOC129597791 [Paramacrobiotus metropolitanus]|uniref:uncharacterized protein LOC129597791 n=1 Tax=Paramacrobiotus metropolitanus TaxID=2943436 RepID=UPI0024456D5F|nr:uncharacterized protein LOC129597791 [Paramacrobiotus metropolitanus]
MDSQTFNRVVVGLGIALVAVVCAGNAEPASGLLKLSGDADGLQVDNAIPDNSIRRYYMPSYSLPWSMLYRKPFQTIRRAPNDMPNTLLGTDLLFKRTVGSPIEVEANEAPWYLGKRSSEPIIAFDQED